ncbi:MAG: serine/threonine-protein kinase [Myxococcota bacterium]
MSPPGSALPIELLERLESRPGHQLFLAKVQGQDALVTRLLPGRPPAVVARFRDRIRRLRLLRSPSLERVLADGELDGLPFVATALLLGEPAAQGLRPLTADQRLSATWELAPALARTVADAHDVGLFHGRIRPERIFMTRGRLPVLTGFFEGPEATDAPFLKRGEGIDDAAFDLYSLAASLHVLATGSLAERPEQLSDRVPPAIRSVLAEALEGAALDADAWALALIEACAESVSSEELLTTILKVAPVAPLRRPADVLRAQLAPREGVEPAPRPTTVVLNPGSDPTPVLDLSVMTADPPEPPDLPEIGGVVANYEILGELGRGSNGVVFAARHQTLGRRVALKLLSARVRGSETAHRRLLRESRALAAVHHRAVVTVFDAGVTESGAPYLAMELIEGPTLTALAPVDLERAISIARELAMGLAVVHAAGLVHRDIKPANILVQVEGNRTQPKLGDFGLVIDAVDVQTRLTRTGWFVGTALFAAPEQLVDPDAVGPAVDLYALGASLYFLLTARPPIVAKGTELLERKLNEQPPVLTEHGELGALIAELLSVDPEVRPTAMEVVARLERLRPNTRTPPLVVPVPMPASENAIWAGRVVTASVSIAAIAAGAILLTQLKDTLWAPPAVAPAPAAPEPSRPPVIEPPHAVAVEPSPAPSSSVPTPSSAPSPRSTPRPQPSRTAAPSPPAPTAAAPLLTRAEVFAHSRRVQEELTKRKDSLPPARLEALDAEYLSVRTALSGAEGPALTDLERRLQALDVALRSP